MITRVVDAAKTYHYPTLSYLFIRMHYIAFIMSMPWHHMTLWTLICVQTTAIETRIVMNRPIIITCSHIVFQSGLNF